MTTCRGQLTILSGYAKYRFMIPTHKEGPVDMVVIYRAKRGLEDALLALVQGHWPTLDRLGLASDSRPAEVWRTRDRAGNVAFVEHFQWKDAQAPVTAHQTPEVMALWEPMGNLMTGMDILEAERVI